MRAFENLGKRFKFEIEQTYSNEASREAAIEDIDRILKDESLEGVEKYSAPMQDIIREARGAIDLMSRTLIHEGVVTGDLAKRVGGNIGTYMMRSFKVFDPESN